jgi:hypothetical protein
MRKNYTKLIQTPRAAFTAKVDARVEEQYGVQDGGDLCFNLLESGVIREDMSIDEAARIVAQHLLQA